VLARLNAGTLETATLAEGLAIDFRTLLMSAFADLEIPEETDLSDKVGITKRMQCCGAILHAMLGLDGLDRIAGHPSDTVRGWAAFVIATEGELSLSRRLKLVQPLADDRHFGVREWAWLALRPSIAEVIGRSVRTLRSWTRRRSENLRRFAVEATRPRGVWCAHIPELKVSPQLGLPLIEPLRADPSKYVQDSVGNWLNDASKSQSDWVRQLCARWEHESPVDATRRICKRALRSLK
jgi:3-methyladenine DNA glycosylase AlkC